MTDWLGERKKKEQKLFLSLFFFQSTTSNVKERLQLDNQLPLIVGHVFTVILLQSVNTSSRDLAVEKIGFFQVSTVYGLVTSHLDLDGDRGLTLFANLDLLVVSLNRGAKSISYQYKSSQKALVGVKFES